MMQICLNIDYKVESTEELFSVFNSSIPWPHYNWNSFHEILTGCLYNPENVPYEITLMHQGIPALSKKEIELYVSALVESFLFWKFVPGKNLFRVLFKEADIEMVHLYTPSFFSFIKNGNWCEMFFDVNRMEFGEMLIVLDCLGVSYEHLTLSEVTDCLKCWNCSFTIDRGLDGYYVVKTLFNNGNYNTVRYSSASQAFFDIVSSIV